MEAVAKGVKTPAGILARQSPMLYIRTMEYVGLFLHWTMRLAPGLVMSSLFFALDGGLRWLGLFGLVLLALSFMGIGCTCSTRGRENRPNPPAFPGI